MNKRLISSLTGCIAGLFSLAAFSGCSKPAPQAATPAPPTTGASTSTAPTTMQDAVNNPNVPPEMREKIKQQMANPSSGGSGGGYRPNYGGGGGSYGR